MPQLTLTDILRLPAFRQASPAVLAGATELDRPVRWAHATERTDVHTLLREGDLVLTTGTGLPADTDAAGLAKFADDLADAHSAGLVIELGRRWASGVPPTLVDACDAARIPLVVLGHEARFATLIQEIGERVIDAQLEELRDVHRVHEAFGQISFT